MTADAALIAPAVILLNGTIAGIEAARLVQEGLLAGASVIQAAAMVTQAGFFYDAASDAVHSRDLLIDNQEAFMTTLETLKLTQDLPMVNAKRDILFNMPLPINDACSSALEMVDRSKEDGKAVDDESIKLSKESCSGVPTGWKTYEGAIMASKAGSYSGGLLANSSKRRIEKFRTAKTKLTRIAHTGMKSLFSSAETLAKYAQATSIHSGLADLYIQGFNSAGAGLGIAIGKLAKSKGNGGVE